VLLGSRRGLQAEQLPKSGEFPPTTENVQHRSLGGRKLTSERAVVGAEEECTVTFDR